MDEIIIIHSGCCFDSSSCSCLRFVVWERVTVIQMLTAAKVFQEINTKKSVFIATFVVQFCHIFIYFFFIAIVVSLLAVSISISHKKKGLKCGRDNCLLMFNVYSNISYTKKGLICDLWERKVPFNV